MTICIDNKNNIQYNIDDKTCEIDLHFLLILEHWRKDETQKVEHVKELLNLFEGKNCDFDKCRKLIKKIGGCTQIIQDKIGGKTTPLHEAICYGHYDFALELIGEPGANLDINPDGWGSVLWNLQYLDAETEEEKWIEIKNKLKLLRALVAAGANPNPTDEVGEDFLSWLNYKIGEGDIHIAEKYFVTQIAHIIEAHTYNQTDIFFEKLKKQKVSYIMLSRWESSLIGYNLCDCSYAVFIFDDGEKILLSSHQVDDDEWEFHASPIYFVFSPENYHNVIPISDSIEIISHYSDEFCSILDLSIDDGILRIRTNEIGITIGIVGKNFDT